MPHVVPTSVVIAMGYVSESPNVKPMEACSLEYTSRVTQENERAMPDAQPTGVVKSVHAHVAFQCQVRTQLLTAATPANSPIVLGAITQQIVCVS